MCNCHTAPLYLLMFAEGVHEIGAGEVLSAHDCLFEAEAAKKAYLRHGKRKGFVYVEQSVQGHTCSAWIHELPAVA